MTEQTAFKRRAVLEKALDANYLGRLVQLPNEECGRIQTIGVEWEGRGSFEVTVNLDGRRHAFDYSQFKEETEILR